MHVTRIGDAGVGHRDRNRRGGFADLRLSADFLRAEIPGVSDPDAETLVAGLWPGAIARGYCARENADMRTEHAFGAARHHKGDPLLDRLRRQSEMRRQRDR